MPHLTRPLALLLVLCACETQPFAVKTAPSPESIGDPARGRTLLAEFQCNRCHTVPGLDPPAADQHCVACHVDIEEARFDAPGEVLVRWQERLAHSDSALTRAPSLVAASRLRQEWIADFLLEPFDLRPALGPTMPRLAIDAQDAADLASALAPPASGDPLPEGDALRGARLLRISACGTCHRLGGEAIGEGVHVDPAGSDATSSMRFSPAVLAPDLIHARRVRPEILAAWIHDARAISPDTQMPSSGMTLADVQDIAAHLSSLARDETPGPVVTRLPVLEREVHHEEVETAVFRRICWHCHSDPGYAHGDGGPGNHGGFGFEARGLDLSSYEGISSGIRNLSTGRRQSVFRPFEMPSGEEVPFLVAALLARRAEEAGAPLEGVRGMPLGMPSLPPEQIQLVETWIAQGYQR